MDAHFAVGLQIQNLRPACAQRMARSGQQWQQVVGVALTAKLTLANIAYNMDRLIFHERHAIRG